MAIPGYETIMLPLLELMRDGRERSVGECIGRLAEEFGLSDEEKRHRLPSGLMPTFNNRVAWARTYMKQAGLLESTRRGLIKITERGRQVLRGNPEKITGRLLSQFPEFVEFQSPKKDNEGNTTCANKQGRSDSRGDVGTCSPANHSRVIARGTETNQDLFPRLLRKACRRASRQNGLRWFSAGGGSGYWWK